jgi:hypothetical protein
MCIALPKMHIKASVPISRRCTKHAGSATGSIVDRMRKGVMRRPGFGEIRREA